MSARQRQARAVARAALDWTSTLGAFALLTAVCLGLIGPILH